MPIEDRYESRGVSSSKKEVHDAISHLDKGIFPNAFCKILPDLVAGDAEFCNIMHADTAGTKTSLAYLYWKETGDISVWKGIIQDALVMNLDDMACVGCIQDIIISSTIGRNKNLIPADVISVLINHTQTFIEEMLSLGIRLKLAGGETADVGDIVRTLDVGFTTFGRIKRSDVINIDIQAGDYIVGFASYGQATYENTYNGGMGSNGLTSARHDVLNHVYKQKYPESFDPANPDDLVYCGKRMLDEVIEIDGNEMFLGKLLLSPTRTYIPVIKAITDLHLKDLHGLIHCSGGGQTKVMKFVQNNVKLIKDNLLPVPPLFQIIQEESNSSWQEMFRVFNMGHRLEAYTSSLESANAMIDISRSFNIEAQIIGRVEQAVKPSLTIVYDGTSLNYEED